METYQIGLIGLSARRIIVLGGGLVALRKIQGLLAAGAKVTVISPHFCPELLALALDNSVTLLDRPYRPGDLAGAFLAIAATDDEQVNAAAWEEANQTGCLINVVDDPQRCHFILPALVRRGDVSLAISTGGSSPALASFLRKKLEDWLEPEIGDLAALMGELRPILIAGFPPGQARLEAALFLINSNLTAILRENGFAAARAAAFRMIAEYSANNNVEEVV